MTKKETEQVEDLKHKPVAETETGETVEVTVVEDWLPPIVVEPAVTVETVKAEMLDRILRLQADFDNYRRRTRQEKSELGAFVTQNLIKELLPIVDNFERALSSRPAEDPSGFGAGVEMIFRQLSALLEKQGVTLVETVGTLFDPMKHEAIMRAEDSDQPEGMVVEELQKGYSVSGKVLRPALVKVVGK